MPISCTFDVQYQDDLTKETDKVVVRWVDDKKQSYQELINRKLDVPPTTEFQESNKSEIMNEILKDKIIEVADELKLKIQYRKQNVKKAPWYNSKCVEGKYKMRNLYRKWNRQRNPDNFQNYVEAKQVYRIVQFESEKQYKENIKQKLSNVKNSSEFWKVINSFKKKSNGKKNDITKEMWETHLNTLYNRAVSPTVEVFLCDAGQEGLTDWFSFSEMEECLKKLKNGKAAGPDMIVNEMYKHLNNTEYLLSLFNNILEYETLPPDWGETEIFCLHKKGDINTPANYRGIALINTLTKLFTQLLHNRIYKWAEKSNMIPEEQAGFRKGRGCIDQIFVLNSLIQIQLRLPGQKLYACFIDFKFCFDGLRHDVIWQKLFHLGVAGKLIRIFRKLYENAHCRIRMENGEYTERVKINCGVLQGDSASPLLFVLVVSDLVSFLRNRDFSGVQIADRVDVFLLMYADDLVLVGHSKIDLQKKIDSLKQYCDLNGLEVNIDKSKIVVFRRGGKLSVHDKFQYGTHKLEIVKTYTYLGVVFSSSGCFRLHMDHALSKAKVALANIRKIMVDGKMESWESRIHLYETVVKVTLLYAAEVWALRYTEEIEKCQVQFVKSILCLGYNTPNHYLRLETGMVKLELTVIKMALSWLSKTSNGTEDRYTKLCMSRIMHLEQNGNYKKEYNWFGQIKHLFLKRNVGCELPINEETLTQYRNKLFSEDVHRLNTSTFNSHYKQIKKTEKVETEKYLLFNMSIEKTRVISQIRTQGNSLCFYIKGTKHRLDTTINCECCNLRTLETIEHVLFECPHYEHLRAGMNRHLPGLLQVENEEAAGRLYHFMSAILRTRKMIRNE
ncbi:hypothetical protein WDU94_005675 [Cyamophila willieti]